MKTAAICLLSLYCTHAFCDANPPKDQKPAASQQSPSSQTPKSESSEAKKKPEPATAKKKEEAPKVAAGKETPAAQSPKPAAEPIDNSSATKSQPASKEPSKAPSQALATPVQKKPTGIEIYKHGDLRIASSECKELMQYLEEFPQSQYHIATIPAFGYSGHYFIDSTDDLIKNHLANGEMWENPIEQLIVKHVRPGSKVLDIGAHIGTHSFTMSKFVGESGEVLAFEPQPKLFRELFWNAALNNTKNIICYSAAVGSECGKIETSVINPRNEGDTPLISPTLSMGNWSYTVKGGTGIFVDLLTIDSLNLDNVSLIKIDVEGMENAVLDGARNTILRNKPTIILEIMGGWRPEVAPDEIVEQIEFTKRKVRNLGYDLTRISRWDYLATPK